MKIFILALFSALSSLLFSQGNLQFNQVINWKIPQQNSNCGGCGIYCANITGTITVPTGKVWKIEESSYAEASAPWSFFIDNYLLFTFEQTAGGGQALHQETNFPIWLPSGTYTFNATYYNSCQTQIPFKGCSTSIIEFNIIP
jgi:hypothetical protein